MNTTIRFALVLFLELLFLPAAWSADMAGRTASATPVVTSPDSTTSIGSPPAKGPAADNIAPVAPANPAPVTPQSKLPHKHKVPYPATPNQEPCTIEDQQCATNKCSSTSSSATYSACLRDQCHIANAACLKSLVNQHDGQ